MNIISNLIATKGGITLPVRPLEFETALQHNTYPAESDDISGYAFKIDEENYAQTFYGHVGNGQFRFRAVEKGDHLKLAKFLITGSYEPVADGTRVSYTLALNPKAVALWLLALAGLLIQLVLTETYVVKSPGIFSFNMIIYPVAGLAGMTFYLKQMLQPARLQFETDLTSMDTQNPDTHPAPATSASRFKPLYATLILLGVVSTLVGAGHGMYNYFIFKRTTTPALGEVVELRGGNSKRGFVPVISYTTTDGVHRTYVSNYSSNPPAYAIGDKVPMFYDPTHPDVVRIDNALEGWFFPANFGLGGIAILIVSGLAYRNRTRKTDHV